jgi:hypothetical protein
VIYFALHYEAVSIKLHSVNGTIFNEQWIDKDLEGSARGLIVALSQHFPGGTKENHVKPQSV